MNPVSELIDNLWDHSNGARITLSNTGAVTDDFGLRDLRRDYPGVKSIARTVLAARDAHPPTIQRDDLDVELLAGRTYRDPSSLIA